MNVECMESSNERNGGSGLVDVLGRGTAFPDPETELEDMLAQMREGFAGNENVEFRVIVEGAPIRLRPSARREVRLVCHEALANAYRHSCADTIEVEMAYRGSELRIVIRDNGIGINSLVLESRPDGSRGLLRMKQQVEGIGGRLRVLSQEGAGTEIEVSIPGSSAFATERKRTSAGWLDRFYMARTEHQARIST